MKADRMIKLSRAILGRAALAIAALGPTAACAKSADQAARPTYQAPTAAGGVTLAAFMSRHERRILADDTDGDGKVSRAEYMAAAKSGKGDPAKRFAKIDQNGDGVLDKSEIDAMLTRRFKRLDTNGDGVLSVDEHAVAHARTSQGAGEGSDS